MRGNSNLKVIRVNKGAYKRIRQNLLKNSFEISNFELLGKD